MLGLWWTSKIKISHLLTMADIFETTVYVWITETLYNYCIYIYTLYLYIYYIYIYAPYISIYYIYSYIDLFVYLFTPPQVLADQQHHVTWVINTMSLDHPWGVLHFAVAEGSCAADVGLLVRTRKRDDQWGKTGVRCGFWAKTILNCPTSMGKTNLCIFIQYIHSIYILLT